MTDSHSIQITVDASSARAELRSLSQQVTSTANSLRQLNGSGIGGSAFSSMARGLADSSRAFSELKRQTSDSGLSNLSREISMLSRGMPVLAREIVAVGSAFIVSKSAVTLFAGALGSAALAEFASDVQKVGNSLLSFRIGIDAVSASSKEQGAALSFIRDAATRIGAPLDSATDSFKALYVNMRSLGRPVDEITKVFSGFQTAMTALHISSRDQALSWREIAETYSQGVIHTRQAILSLGSHIPGMAANLQQALGVSGERLHAMFKAGGLPLDTWTKVAALLEKQYGAQIPEAFRHSQQNIVALQNSFTQFKQVVFDSGFDSGFTTFLKSLQSGLDSIGLDNIGKRIGEAFRVGFTAASLMLEKIIALREPITFVAQALLGYAAASAAIRLAAGAVALLFSPLAMAAAGAVLLTTQWDSLKSVFGGGDSAFNAGAEAIKRLTGGYLDLQKAIKGAVELWELSKGLFSGKSFAESRGLAAQAGQAFDAGEYGRRSGTDFTSGFIERASTLFGKLGDVFKLHVPDIGLKTLGDDWSRLYKQSEPTSFHGGGDYAGNAARYAKPDLSLSEELKKVYERLLPTNKALAEYRQQLESIAKMRGKLDPLSGKAIGDEQIRRMTATARADAFESSFPMASKIQEKLDELRAASDMLGSKSGKTSFDAEREVLREVNALKRKGVEIRDDEVDALRKIVTLEKELQKGGSDALSQWAHNQKSQIESMNDAIKSGLDSFADGVAKIATEGKGKFKSLGQAIRSEMSDILRGIARNMISSSIKSLMADGIKSLDIGNMKGRLTEALGLGQGVVDKANSALDKFSTSDALKSVAEMSVNAGIVNLNASGLTGFSPSGFNANAVGGVEPKSATESLFAGNALGGREQSIDGNSVKRFAEALALKKGNAPDTITRDSVSEFGRIISLQKSAPLAEQIGVKPLADSTPSRMLDGISRMTTRPGTDMIHVNDKLKDILDNASKQLPDGWRAQYISGYRHTGAVNPNSRHDHGLAADVQLFDDKGKSLPNYQSPETFRAYESYAQSARRYQTKTYPELNDKFAWGGYFSHGGKPFGYGAADQMHFDLGGHQGIMGDWQHGLTRGRGIYDTPSNPSRGMGAGLTEGRSAFNANAMKPLSDSTAKVAKDFERNMRAATDKFAPEFTKDLSNATKSAGNGGGSGDIGKATNDATKNVNQQSADATGSLTQLGGSIANLATNSKNAPSAIAGVAQSIMSLISQLSSGAGGGGGGAGGLISAGMSLLGGLFEEGGYSGSAVTSAAMPASYWAGAPHYAEGTPNTSGAMPAILHDNEAVIPLSRGREIPVDLKGAAGGGDTLVTYNMHSNVQARDFDSFRRNTNQMAANFHKMAARMHVRNN
jgi:hypothetical protein